MRKFWLAGIGLFALAGGAVAQANLQQVVTDRREGLKAMGAHLEALQAIARSGGDTRPAVARITEVETWFADFSSRFPAGTAMGAPGIDSKAQPAIWTERPNFERLAPQLLTRLATLKETAASGNSAAFGTALQATGAACGECHRPYRSR